ncbi:AroM family protein [Liquorilactobacillus vini]|uniref:AroM family protein n=1 Tax=Liquorilactobacillus vini TaxID=238015 RepID=UPI000704E5A4|nr:AroM family protein [Liquorilactobacillus vini]
MIKKICLLTIGQAPRVDVAPAIEEELDNNLVLEQAGALDNFTYEQVQKSLFSRESSGRYELVSRMRDGRQVVMDRSKLEPVIQRKIDYIEKKGIKVILLLCTGEFEKLQTKTSLLVQPDKVIPSVVKNVIGRKKLGVIVPLVDQIKDSQKKFSIVGLNAVFAAASPYSGTEEDFGRAVSELLKKNVDFILMDCMGYTKEWQSYVGKVSKKPVILSNILIAKIITEFV